MHNETCEFCYGSGIEVVKVEMPDGSGGYDLVDESRPCSECG